MLADLRMLNLHHRVPRGWLGMVIDLVDWGWDRDRDRDLVGYRLYHLFD